MLWELLILHSWERVKTEPIMESLKVTFGPILYLIFYLKTKKKVAVQSKIYKYFLLQGIFPTQGSIPHLLCLQPLAGGFFTTCITWEACANIYWRINSIWHCHMYRDINTLILIHSMPKEVPWVSLFAVQSTISSLSIREGIMTRF